ncbi:hypothetical protein AAA089_15395 [Faecalibacterium prausnitzii]
MKNSDFKPFLGILGRKMSDLWVYVREGIGVYFGIVLAGESVPGVVMEGVSRNYLLTDWKR